MTRLAVVLLGSLLCCAAAAADEDPYLWLEDVDAPRSLEWVKAQNAISTKELESQPDFKPTYERLLSIMDSEDRIPDIVKRGDWLYNFWQDAAHPRGVWRRTTLAEYRKPDGRWDTVLDLDRLSSDEKTRWVFKGATCVHPAFDRCLVSLSDGGGDATIVREFDVNTRAFVTGGFVLPQAKSDVVWRDRDRVYVATDFGPGTMTGSGYPRIVKEWARGTPLASARTVFEGEATDVGSSASVMDYAGGRYEVIERTIRYYDAETYLRSGDHFAKLPLPRDAAVNLHRRRLFVRLRSDWDIVGRHYAAGSLLAIDLVAFLEGSRTFDTLFEPTARTALMDWEFTRDHVLLSILDNVRGRVQVLSPRGGRWTRESLALPEHGMADASGFDEETSNQYFLSRQDPVTPTRLELGTPGRKERTLLRQLPAFYDARDVVVTQHEATSRDGTKVPYFQIGRSSVALDGRAPTLLYGYGGFEIPQLAGYSGNAGASWLERGGIFVMAGGRGGGEYGPLWHTSAILENRQRAFDDFIAIADDLVARKVTSPAHLGIRGGSNGGLLVAVAMLQRPDLFGAVVCQVPLLDMKRYSHLLAGASWMGEYGDPDDPAQWAFLSQYSPYQNVKAGTHYPRVLFMTSTRDDRVHPGHARKMAARMLEQQHDLLYYESIEGGHPGSTTNQQRAYMEALGWAFLWKQLR